MADDNAESKGVSRRKMIAATGMAGVAGLAGCSGGGDGSDGDGGGNQSTTGGGGLDDDLLTGDGSSTVFPIANGASSVWGSNAKNDPDYWSKETMNEYNTDKRIADYFASLYGYEPTGERSVPPFRTKISLSHSGTGVEAVSSGATDFGNASAPVQVELPERESYENFVDHVVGVDGQPICVSKQVKEGGVTQLTIEELRQIYLGEITNWSEVGGPDKKILVLGRASNSGTASSFRANVFPNTENVKSKLQIQNRFGQNQQLKTAIANNDNAISYLALKFVNPQTVPPVGLKVDDTLYEYGKNLDAKDYPLSRDLHMYTWKDTGRQEAAFLNFILSDYGQENFVAANNYFTLSDSRRQAQREKVKPSKYE